MFQHDLYKVWCFTLDLTLKSLLNVNLTGATSKFLYEMNWYLDKKFHFVNLIFDIRDLIHFSFWDVKA